MKPEEYTYKWLTDNGYTRESPDKYRGIGFVRYIKGQDIAPFGGKGYYEDEIVFCGNNAVMESHAEGVWKRFFPSVYGWWTKADFEKRVLLDNGRGGPWKPGNTWRGYPKMNTFIKGEDPFLMKEEE